MTQTQAPTTSGCWGLCVGMLLLKTHSVWLTAFFLDKQVHMNEMNPLKLKLVDLETVNDVNKIRASMSHPSQSGRFPFKLQDKHSTQPPEKNKVKDSGIWSSLETRSLSRES